MCTRGAISLFHVGKILRKTSCSYKSRAAKYLYSSQTRLSSNNSFREKLTKDETTEPEHDLAPTVGTKYKVFRDEDAEVIFDVNEERKKIVLEELNAMDEYDPYEGLNLEHGTKGVFEIEDLIKFLRKESAIDIFVVSVPPELTYVDYLVIVTGKSQRHMKALAEFSRKLYKLKRHDGDPIPKIEGKNCNDWIALDLGNIALHIFSKSARTVYDLETLWTVGSKYDDEFNKVYANLELLEKHNLFLADLRPADSA